MSPIPDDQREQRAALPPDPAAVAADTVARVRRTLAVDGSTLTFWDIHHQVLVPLAYDDERMVDPDPIFHPGQGLSGAAFAADAPVVAGDYTRDVPHPPAWTTACSGISVPLRAGGRAIGALSAQHYSPRTFTDDDVAALERVAAEVGPQLATLGTLARAQRRTAEASALATLMRRGAAVDDEQELFTLIADFAIRLLGADLAGIVQRGPRGGTQWCGVVGNVTELWRDRVYGGEHPAAATIFGESIEVVQGLDGGTIDPARFPFFAAEGIRTGVAAPLATSGPSLGALCFGWRFDLDVAPPHLELAEALAGFAGTLLAAAAARGEREALVANAPVLLLSIDVDGVVTLCEGAGAADVGRGVADVLAGEPAVADLLARPGEADESGVLYLELGGRAFDARIVRHDEGVFLVATDVTERRTAERTLARRASEDELTGLPNAAEILRRAVPALAGGDLCVVVADVRSFDYVNETIGYEEGDELLALLGARLAAELSDAVAVGRTGGDEFTVVGAGLDAEALGRRVRACLEALIVRGDGTETAIDVRCGIAAMPAGGDASLLLRHADAALQLARRGTASIVAWDATVAEGRRRQLELTGELRRALEAGAFDVAYQPIVDAATGAVRRVEALARWTRPDGTPVSPGVFIDLAERLGRIGQLTAVVLDRALADVAAPHRLIVNVNVSPLDITQGELPMLVAERLAAHRVAPGLLCVEVTESAELEAGTATLDQLVDAGVGIAVDDFGRGWSSLGLLKRLPAGELKLDRSYVARVTENRGDRAIVAAAVALGHAFGMEIVAEGVEDTVTMEAARDLGCDLIQGYLVARPMPAAELAAWLAAQRREAALGTRHSTTGID